jgi:hypothetical protein
MSHFFGVACDLICRDETCERLDVHTTGEACIFPSKEFSKLRRKLERKMNTRSRRYQDQPWRTYSHEGLRESVLKAVSFVEPRNFSSIVAFVENDYGSCCERSIHRHLGVLRATGQIVRMDFHGKIHAYVRTGSKLVNYPDLVLEQIIELNAGYGCGRGSRAKTDLEL